MRFYFSLYSSFIRVWSLFFAKLYLEVCLGEWRDAMIRRRAYTNEYSTKADKGL